VLVDERREDPVDNGVLAALASPAGRRAIARSEVGAIVRLARCAQGLRQVELAERTGWSQAVISQVETGRSKTPDILTDLADALGVPRDLVTDSRACGGVRVGEEHSDPVGELAATVDDVKRRTFLKLGSGVAAGAVMPTPVAGLAELTSPGRRIGTSTIAAAHETLARLQQAEECFGGGAVLEATSKLARQLLQSLGMPTGTPKVAADLRSIAASAAETAGWRAYDAGDTQTARTWWLEALHTRDFGPGTEEAQVFALASMSTLAARDQRDGPTAVALAESAGAIAATLGSAALQSLVTARAAVGYAAAGDAKRSAAALAKASSWLDRVQPASEPGSLTFWGPADLACHEMHCGRFLRRTEVRRRAAAEAAGRATSQTSPRNKAMYDAAHAGALASSGRLDEAIDIASEVLASPVLRGSIRLRTELGHTAATLAAYDYEPAREFAAASRRLAGPLAS
jgi:transcriptional regulator with XRE-family HTH domain